VTYFTSLHFKTKSFHINHGTSLNITTLHTEKSRTKNVRKDTAGSGRGLKKVNIAVLSWKNRVKSRTIPVGILARIRIGHLPDTSLAEMNRYKKSVPQAV
jgi:hypothetical protein